MSSLSKSLSVQHVPLDGKLLEHLRGPLAKLRRPFGVHAIAHGDDGVEVVEIDVPRDLPFAFGLNYSEFPNSWLTAQLA